MESRQEDAGSIRGATKSGDQESQRGMPHDFDQKTSVIVCEDLYAVQDAPRKLRRGLKSRHVAMIAIGGAIG